MDIAYVRISIIVAAPRPLVRIIYWIFHRIQSFHLMIGEKTKNQNQPEALQSNARISLFLDFVFPHSAEM